MQIWKKKLKAEKLQDLTKYPLKIGRQENLVTYFFNYEILCINKPEKRNEWKIGDLGITKNYWGITLTAVAKVYACLLSPIQP